MSATPPRLLAVLACGLLAAHPATESVEFTIEETLSLPTGDSIVLAMVPAVGAELYAAYGIAGGRRHWQTPVEHAPADETVELLLTGLKPGGHYDVQVWARPEGSAEAFEGRAVLDFHTLRRPGTTFSFAYTADAHLYDKWAAATFGTNDSGYLHARQSMENLAADGSLDFFILAGDHASTHCHNCPGGTADGTFYAADFALTVEQARLRYRKLLAPEHMGQVTRRMPFFYALGNHEGETGPAMIGCGHSLPNAAASRAARREAFPDPHRFFEGNEEGTYYAFETGDALLVVIDVMGFSPALPQAPGDWTLGDEQLAWLDKVLDLSHRKWTFVVAEHLVGGVKIGLAQCYHYGRGGLRATGNNLPVGNFRGEQALVQAMLVQHNTPGGASFFMSGHDHVAMIPTEKPDYSGSPTRTYYLKAGSIGAAAGSWRNEPQFKTQMDWDLDGEADYYGDEIGSLKRGYWRITVEGTERVTFEYVVTDPWSASLNGSVLLTRTIEAE